MEALNLIRNAGFSISLIDDGFEVEPASALNQNQRAFLKFHRSEIIESLKKEALLVTVWTPAGNPMRVQASDAEHAAFLRRMNPRPASGPS